LRDRDRQLERVDERQGFVAGTRSGLPGALFGKICVDVHFAASFASAITGTLRVSMYISPGPMTFG
jgi:hypothetical protein